MINYVKMLMVFAMLVVINVANADEPRSIRIWSNEQLKDISQVMRELSVVFDYTTGKIKPEYELTLTFPRNKEQIKVLEDEFQLVPLLEQVQEDAHTDSVMYIIPSPWDTITRDAENYDVMLNAYKNGTWYPTRDLLIERWKSENKTDSISDEDVIANSAKAGWVYGPAPTVKLSTSIEDQISESSNKDKVNVSAFVQDNKRTIAWVGGIAAMLIFVPFFTSVEPQPKEEENE